MYNDIERVNIKNNLQYIQILKIIRMMPEFIAAVKFSFATKENLL